MPLPWALPALRSSPKISFIVFIELPLCRYDWLSQWLLVINITGNWPMGRSGMSWKFCPSTHLLAFVVTSSNSEASWGPSNLHLTRHVGRVFAHAWVRVYVWMCLDMCYVQARCSCWMTSFVILRWAVSDTSSAAWQPASLLWDRHVCLLRVEIAGELPCWPSLYMGSGDSKSGPCVCVAYILVSAIPPAIQNIFMMVITQSSFSSYILPF